jgi:hypothetical protein
MSEERNREATLEEPQEVDKVPLVPFKVIDTNIPFFSDSECQEIVEDARITILQALDPEDPILEEELVPSTNQYNPGDYVTMNLDSKKLWEESWYRHPSTGKVEKAWEIHVNFIGDRISKSAIEKDRDRITDLEQQVEKRMRVSPADVQ